MVFCLGPHQFTELQYTHYDTEQIGIWNININVSIFKVSELFSPTVLAMCEYEHAPKCKAIFF